jgi:Amt family ammonium transporter
MDPNVVWQLLCTGFVLLMTVPGLALYYGGLVRRKNVLSVMIQCLYLLGLLTLCWALWGYSLALGEGNRLIGGLGNLVLMGFPIDDRPLAEGMNRLSNMVFHGAVCVFAGTLICGAVAERMKLTSLTIFMVLWVTLVYCPLCHWVWGGGFLDVQADSPIFGGALDHAGGLVIHLAAGISALVSAFVVGKRLGYLMDDMRPHNLTYTVTGVGVIWIGSLFMYGGHTTGTVALNAVVHTHLSVAAGAVTWATFEWFRQGRASALGTASGAIAGMVCAAPASGYLEPQWAIVLGSVASLAGYLSCAALARIRLFDDSLDVFGLHAVPAIVGLVCTGFFASPVVQPDHAGAFFGGGLRPVLAQLGAIGIVSIWAGLLTILILKLVDLLIGLRVGQENEMQGLDVAQHGQEGYIFNK